MDKPLPLIGIIIGIIILTGGGLFPDGMEMSSTDKESEKRDVSADP